MTLLLQIFFLSFSLLQFTHRRDLDHLVQQTLQWDEHTWLLRSGFWHRITDRQVGKKGGFSDKEEKENLEATDSER